MNIEIKISKKPINYQSAINFLEKRVQDICNHKAKELLWILEHQNIYTCGISGKPEELLEKNKIPTIQTNRGGKWTYHGKGQKIVYIVLNLNNRGKAIKKLIRSLEQWIIAVLNYYKIQSFADSKNVGIWIKKNNEEYKIAAIGIKVKKWIAYHGFAINLDVDKNYYKGIIPCGISDKGIINFSELRTIPKDQDINSIIIEKFKETFKD